MESITLLIAFGNVIGNEVGSKWSNKINYITFI